MTRPRREPASLARAEASLTFHLVGHFRALADHRVRYLIVGGVGGRLQGVPTTTGDLDIVPDPDLDNLQRLAVALSGPNTWKKPVDSVEFVQHPVVEPSEFWSERMTQYRTVNGGIDVLIELPGVGKPSAGLRGVVDSGLSWRCVTLGRVGGWLVGLGG